MSSTDSSAANPVISFVLSGTPLLRDQRAVLRYRSQHRHRLPCRVPGARRHHLLSNATVRALSGKTRNNSSSPSGITASTIQRIVAEHGALSRPKTPRRRSPNLSSVDAGAAAATVLVVQTGEDVPAPLRRRSTTVTVSSSASSSGPCSCVSSTSLPYINAAPEIRSGLEYVARSAEHLNVARHVLAPECKRLHMVHVHHVREDERAAPCTAGTTTSTDQSTETSGPREHPDQHRTASTPSTDRSPLAVVLVVFLAASAVRRRLGAVDTAHVAPWWCSSLCARPGCGTRLRVSVRSTHPRRNRSVVKIVHAV